MHVLLLRVRCMSHSHLCHLSRCDVLPRPRMLPLHHTICFLRAEQWPPLQNRTACCVSFSDVEWRIDSALDIQLTWQMTLHVTYWLDMWLGLTCALSVPQVPRSGRSAPRPACSLSERGGRWPARKTSWTPSTRSSSRTPSSAPRPSTWRTTRRQEVGKVDAAGRLELPGSIRSDPGIPGSCTCNITFARTSRVGLDDNKLCWKCLLVWFLQV